MKKLYSILILSVLFVGTQICLGVVTTTRPVGSHTQKPKPTVKKTVPSVQKPKTSSSGNRLVDNVKMCKPYREGLKTDYMGMNFVYNISIDGWVNNKCRMNFSADAAGTSSTFKQLYGVDASDATVLSFAPKIRCDFTKQQLEYVGDSILQEEERNAGARNNMLKDPKNIDISSFANLSGNDLKLLDVIMNQGACTLLNTNDLNKIMDSILF